MRRISPLVAALATVFAVGSASATDILIDGFDLPNPGVISLFDTTVGGAVASLNTVNPSAFATNRLLTHDLTEPSGLNVNSGQSSVGIGAPNNQLPNRLNINNGSAFNAVVTVEWTLGSLSAVLGDRLVIDALRSNIGSTADNSTPAPNMITAYLDNVALGTHILTNNFTGPLSFALSASDIGNLGSSGTLLKFQFSGNADWDGSFDNVRVVPEPTSLALVGLALVGAGVASRRRKA